MQNSQEQNLSHFKSQVELKHKKSKTMIAFDKFRPLVCLKINSERLSNYMATPRQPPKTAKQNISRFKSQAEFKHKKSYSFRLFIDLKFIWISSATT